VGCALAMSAWYDETPAKTRASACDAVAIAAAYAQDRGACSVRAIGRERGDLELEVVRLRRGAVVGDVVGVMHDGYSAQYGEGGGRRVSAGALGLLGSETREPVPSISLMAGTAAAKGGAEG
jgi:hypothetical protein